MRGCTTDCPAYSMDVVMSRYNVSDSRLIRTIINVHEQNVMIIDPWDPTSHIEHSSEWVILKGVKNVFKDYRWIVWSAATVEICFVEIPCPEHDFSGTILCRWARVRSSCLDVHMSFLSTISLNKSIYTWCWVKIYLNVCKIVLLASSWNESSLPMFANRVLMRNKRFIRT